MKLLKNMTLLALTFLYVTAGLGYGLHICDAEGSITPLVMINEASCESVHNHSHTSGCSGECSSNCNHDEECCHTEVYQIKEGYEATALFQLEQPTVQLLPFIILSGSIQSCFETSVAEENPKPEYSPPENVPENYHSRISVWRL